MNILGVIPARYASTRFPGKPLAIIKGKSMVERVYLQAKKTTHITKLVVATDDQRIYDHVLAFGGEACMTSDTHPSGTDRCGEVLEKSIGFDAVVNIQGDEPCIDPAQIDSIALALKEGAPIATLCKVIENEEERISPNVVKVVKSVNGKALYFSRATIPFNRDQKGDVTYYKHIGLYGYTKKSLDVITKLPKSTLENCELLEQLRWLENDLDIRVLETLHNSIGVDSPEDINKILTLLTKEMG